MHDTLANIGGLLVRGCVRAGKTTALVYSDIYQHAARFEYAEILNREQLGCGSAGN